MADEAIAQLRKRILTFYFAAGINIVMALWVVSVAAGRVSGLALGGIVFVFVGFAWLNFYMAKVLRRRLEAQMRQRSVIEGQSARVND